MLLYIKKLLHQEKFTIAGALEEIKQELIDLRRMLD